MQTLEGMNGSWLNHMKSPMSAKCSGGGESRNRSTRSDLSILFNIFLLRTGDKWFSHLENVRNSISSFPYPKQDLNKGSLETICSAPLQFQGHHILQPGRLGSSKHRLKLPCFSNLQPFGSFSAGSSSISMPAAEGERIIIVMGDIGWLCQLLGIVSEVSGPLGPLGL